MYLIRKVTAYFQRYFSYTRRYALFKNQTVRSPKLPFFLNRISEANNYLSHLLFVLEQFDLDNNSLLTNKKRQSELTTVVFKNNKQAKIHNVKLSFLNEQKNESIDFLKNTVFININTQFEVYLKNIYLFKKENFDANLKELNKFKVYETFIENLGLSNKLSELNKSTYDYFVLRRNALVHRDKTKLHQGEFADKIKSDGKVLNRNWKNYSKEIKNNNLKSHTVDNFNFSTKNVNTFNFDELISTMNFYRLFSMEIDNLIVKELNNDCIHKYLFTKFKTIYPDIETFNIFSKKFSHFSNSELNLEIKPKELEKIWNRSSVG